MRLVQDRISAIKLDHCPLMRQSALFASSSRPTDPTNANNFQARFSPCMSCSNLQRRRSLKATKKLNHNLPATHYWSAMEKCRSRIVGNTSRLASQKHQTTTGGQPATSTSTWQMRKRARGSHAANRALPQSGHCVPKECPTRRSKLTRRSRWSVQQRLPQRGLIANSSLIEWLQSFTWTLLLNASVKCAEQTSQTSRRRRRQDDDIANVLFGLRVWCRVRNVRNSTGVGRSCGCAWDRSHASGFDGSRQTPTNYQRTSSNMS